MLKGTPEEDDFGPADHLVAVIQPVFVGVRQVRVAFAAADFLGIGQAIEIRVRVGGISTSIAFFYVL